MTFKAQVAHGLRWQAVSIIGKQVFSLVVATTLARLLDPSAFGLMALVSVYLGIVTMFIDQGLGVALIQRQDLEPDHKDAVFWFNLGCATILCLGTMALAGPVSVLFKEPLLAAPLRVSSLGLVIGASSSIHATLFVKAMDFRQPVIRTLIANATGGSIGVGLALAGLGFWALVWQQLASEIAGGLFLWSLSTYRPAFRFSFPHLRQLFAFGSSAFASSMLWLFRTNIDKIIIGRFAGTSTLGLYTIAGKVPSMANTVTQQPLLSISVPSMSRLQNDNAKMRRAVCRGMELNAVVSFPVFVGLAIISPELVPLLLGPKWAAAAALCSLLSLCSLIEVLQVLFYSILLSSGGIGKYVVLNIFETIGVLIACLVGIRLGVTYVVMGLIVNSIVMAVPALFFIRQRIGLRPVDFCKPCLVPAAASLFMTGVIWMAILSLPKATAPAMLLAYKVVIGAITYLGFMMIFKRAMLISLLDMVGHAAGFRSKAPSTIASSTHKAMPL